MNPFEPDADGSVRTRVPGTATSGVACVLLGREWVGVELEAGYCEIARARLLHARAS